MRDSNLAEDWLPKTAACLDTPAVHSKLSGKFAQTGYPAYSWTEHCATCWCAQSPTAREQMLQQLTQSCAGPL